MIEVVNFKHVNSETLKGSFDVKFLGNPSVPDFVVRDFKVMQKNGKTWVMYPSKQYEKDGEKKYMSYVYFDDFEDKKSFDVKLLEKSAPFLENF